MNLYLVEGWGGGPANNDKHERRYIVAPNHEAATEVWMEKGPKDRGKPFEISESRKLSSWSDVMFSPDFGECDAPVDQPITMSGHRKSLNDSSVEIGLDGNPVYIPRENK
jgi:hypothetical protein